MSQELLHQLLKGSLFNKYLDIDPYGLQLPSFIATVYGIKPAMDTWVYPYAWPSFHDLLTDLGLYYHVDGYFNRNLETISKIQSPVEFTTTRAAFSNNSTTDGEAHVFIACSKRNLSNVVGAGWYPLVVNGQIISKHLADHDKFGLALGYPECCREFFRKNNNWHYDNTYYIGYKNSSSAPNILSNGLLRHTAFSFISHMACSFSCEHTIYYGAELRSIIAKKVSASYASEISRRLATPILCLSELRIYRFEGFMQSSNHIKYNSVESINPTKSTDPLYQMLLKGNSCIIDANIIRVNSGSREIYAYQARADQHGPEIPFFIQCGSY